jgi:hypothetical protein
MESSTITEPIPCQSPPPEGYFSFSRRLEAGGILQRDIGRPEVSRPSYGIALVFDYKTPQFDTEFSAISAMINFWMAASFAVKRDFTGRGKYIQSEEPRMNPCPLRR